MKTKLFPSLFVLGALLSSAVSVRAVELGGGYNEQITNIYNALIVKSGIKWARAYVNIPRNYLTFAYPFGTPPPNPISGIVEGNIFQEPSLVSSDADVLAVAAVDRLINAKTVMVDGEPMKIILSLKQDFTYPYDPHGPPDQRGRVPSTIQEIGFLLTAIEDLLTTNNRGQYIDILVVGNEPMFEVQPNTDQTTADNYITYLNYLVPALANLRTNHNWTFEIFVGALNHPSAPHPANNTILPAILNFLRDNPDLVGGIDLHEHVMDPSDVLPDIQLVKQYLQPGQKIISTEFSLIELWKAHQTQQLGQWGRQHGYSENTLVYCWINDLIQRAAAGHPVSGGFFMSFFDAQRWYPKHWFRTMFDTFEAQGVYAVTYGLEETPRYPWEANQLTGDSVPWVLNAVYNGTILGTSPQGYYNTNPLVFPDFHNAIGHSSSFQGAGPSVGLARSVPSSPSPSPTCASSPH